MGVLRQLFTGRPDPVLTAAVVEGPTFAATNLLDVVDSAPADFDPMVFGLTGWGTDPTALAPRMDRERAMQVPAVKRVRDLIAGSIGQLPIEVRNRAGQVVPWSMLDQPEADRPRVITLTHTVEDLLFEGQAFWQVTTFGWHTYPTFVKRLHPRAVSVNEGRVYYKGEALRDDEVIRFHSPNDALLCAGARAIRTCLMLDAAASRFAEGVPPIDYFTPAEGYDPADDAEIIAVLDQWKTARQTRSTGYVPAALKYNQSGFSPDDLQMADARNHAVLEIARLAGVDPEDLGVSTTSRTYQNSQDRRKDFIDFTLGPYLTAVEGRLSMNDATPQTYTARFNLSNFMRSDDKTRMETASVGLEKRVLSEAEAKQYFDPSTNVSIETPQTTPALEPSNG